MSARFLSPITFPLNTLKPTFRNLKSSPITIAPPQMAVSGEQAHQYVVVMRHGDRLDNVDPSWLTMAERKWDPPLHPDGMARASEAGLRIRNTIGAPINRIFVSPFLRCLQTASEAARSLCTVDDGSEIKASVEIGLCEVMNTIAIRANVAPKDGEFKFDLSECEAKLPAGTIDHSAEKVLKKLPEWGETLSAAKARYMEVVKALADKYPHENLLLVTHGEGVASVFSTIMNGVTVYEVDYCGFTILRRSIHWGQNQSSTCGEFMHQSEFGIRYLPTTAD